jgi:hypothetical protein
MWLCRGGTPFAADSAAPERGVVLAPLPPPPLTAEAEEEEEESVTEEAEPARAGLRDLFCGCAVADGADAVGCVCDG